MSNSTLAPRRGTGRWVLGAAGLATVAAAGILSSAPAHSAVTAAPPEVFSGFDNLDLIGSAGRTNSITVPAGSYSIHAKAFVSNDGNVGTTTTTCRLSAGGNFDDSAATVSGSARAALALQVVHETSASRTITLSCTKSGSSNLVRMEFVKITATRVNDVAFDLSM